MSIFHNNIITRKQLLDRANKQKIQRPLRTQRENRSLTAESLKTQGRTVFFSQRLGRVQFQQDTKAVKNAKRK
ncbi:hypothetical protein DDV21_010765 [Streptococcus chenjunshii]|uniref:Uncharacterized protein n=1 Tax=Streptococcus chenjunshii TaxID=2173853 RepID=A0A372KJG0_9STRE|nr:hypothetical protein DDV21_010765 [Streptococcus chenjunshii]RFU50803.1 hypothetical protein DDV22_06770 [Streptococcus chenjunshii]RFU52442.1 hypothetical protein DDV23_09755 [Streptococcus chenjunshii]